jgi:quinolinate synthase
MVCAVGFLSDAVARLRPDLPVLVPRADAGCPLSQRADAALAAAVRLRARGARLCAGPKCEGGVLGHCDTIMSLNPETGFFELPGGRDTVVLPTLRSPDGTLRESLRDIAPECQVHALAGPAEVLSERGRHPGALVLLNSLAGEEARAAADFSGDSDALFGFAASSEAREFVVLAEAGLAESLSLAFPGKAFHEPGVEIFCPNMKLTNIKDLLAALEAHQAGPPQGLARLAGAGEPGGKTYDLFG